MVITSGPGRQVSAKHVYCNGKEESFYTYPLREVEEIKMTDSFNEVSLGLPIILRGSVFFFSSFN